MLDFGGCPAYAFEPPCADQDDGHAVLPGTATNGLSVADQANLDIVGDITMIADVALDDWTPGVNTVFIGKWSVAAQLSYVLSVDGFGTPQFRWSNNGSTVNTIGANANFGGLSPGSRRAVRVDFDVDNGAAGRTAHFFHAPTSAGPWERLGTAQTTATATTIFPGTSALQMGYSSQLTSPLVGKFYRGQIYQGASFTETRGGTLAVDVNVNVVSDPAQVAFAATGVVGGVSVVRTGSPATVLNAGTPFWEPLTFATPAIDDAPWYHPAYPQTADGLGFFIEEWTGLDDGHVARGMAPTGRVGGGATHGVLSARERVMKLNVLMFARSELAMQALFEWLERTLYSVCARCASESMLLRKTCPPIVNTTTALWEGVVELREVALIEGLTWESPISQAGGCFLRRASFTLAAADPCMYHNGTTLTGPQATASVFSCYDALALGTASVDCRPRCFDLATNCRTVYSFEVDTLQAAAPIVTLANNSDAPVLPLRVLCYADPNDLGAANVCSMPLLGEFYTRVMPPWSQLQWDVVGRKIWYTDATTGGYVSGYPYVDANDVPIPRFFVLPCGTHHVVVEPGNVCLTEDIPGARYIYQGQAFDWVNLHFPDVSVEVVPRSGCP